MSRKFYIITGITTIALLAAGVLAAVFFMNRVDVAGNNGTADQEMFSDESDLGPLKEAQESAQEDADPNETAEDTDNTATVEQEDTIADTETSENGSTTTQNEDADPDNETTQEEGTSITAEIIVYTDSGFSPSTLTIAAGTTVAFQNNSSGSFWPASDNHPTHTLYPEGSCSFDPCESIEAGGSWSFTFNETGTWGYHDHLSPGRGGTIIVE